MSDRWTGWKSFPDDYHGEYIQAPIGPGLYEVCRASTGEQVAFGCTRERRRVAVRGSEAARARASWPFVPPRSRRAIAPASWNTAPGRRRPLADAKIAAELMLAQRQAVMRRFVRGAR